MSGRDNDSNLKKRDDINDISNIKDEILENGDLPKSNNGYWLPLIICLLVIVLFLILIFYLNRRSK